MSSVRPSSYPSENQGDNLPPSVSNIRYSAVPKPLKLLEDDMKIDDVRHWKTRAKGEAKKVMVVDILHTSHGPDSLPNQSVLGTYVRVVAQEGKLAECKVEYGIRKEIEKKIGADSEGLKDANLYLDIETLTVDDLKEELKKREIDEIHFVHEADDRYMKKAFGSLETYIVAGLKVDQDPEIEGVAVQKIEGKMIIPPPNLQQSLLIVRDVFFALKLLHSLDMMHGDLKPDNFLMRIGENGKLTACLTDFGKTQQVKEGDSLLYSGNSRFANPEGRLAKQGEVFSAALLAIWILEQRVLDANGDLRDTDGHLLEGLSDRKEGEGNLRGIERYIADHPKFPGVSQNAGAWDKLICRAKLAAGSADREEINRLLTGYIDVLCGKLVEGGLNQEQTKQLNQLLREMVKANPEERLSMDDVVQFFDENVTNPNME